MASALPNGLFAKGSSELKQHVANSFAAGFVTWCKTNIPAATGAVSVTNVLYAMMSPVVWSVIPALIFVVCTTFVMQAPKFLPKSLPTGTEVIIATAAATLYSIHANYTGNVVGEIPELDPEAGLSLGPLKIPVSFLNINDVIDAPVLERFGGSYPSLIISATLFAAVNFLSIMGIASVFEQENGIAWSPPRELAAQGAVCGVAAVVGSAPVSASLSRSLVSRMAGTTSCMSAVVTSLLWIYLMPYMSVMSSTPQAALSAIIMSAVIKSVVFPKDLLAMKGSDFIIGWGTALATAFTSPTIGFGLGLVLYFAVGLLKPKVKED